MSRLPDVGRLEQSIGGRSYVYPMKSYAPLAVVLLVLAGRPSALLGQMIAESNLSTDKPKGRVSQTVLELLKQDAGPLPLASAEPEPTLLDEPILNLEKITVTTRRAPDLSPPAPGSKMERFLQDGTLWDWSHGTKKILVEPHKGKLMLGFRLAF